MASTHVEARARAARQPSRRLPADSEGLEPRVLFAVITVTGTGDTVAPDGVTTLREAILAANGAAGADTIRFNIAPAGAKTIAPTSPLPQVTDAVFIDGDSQPGAVPAGTKRIELRGDFAGAGADGLFIRANGSVVRGLAINRFRGDGIEIFNATNVTIIGNYLGTNAAGTAAFGNGGGPGGSGAGVTMNSGRNRVGTNGDGFNDAAERNVISGNGAGVVMGGAAADGNVVAGNYIGTNAAGTAGLGNRVGVALYNGADANVVGTDGAGATAAERNVIAGNRRTSTSQNFGAGVAIYLNANGNRVAGNYVGTTAAGSAALPNDFGVSAGQGSTGNIIGTNGDGTGDAAERNVISGNLQTGVTTENSNVIAGNYIGVAANGANALGNGDIGVLVTGSSNRVGTNADGRSDAQERNVIAAAGRRDGVLIQNPNVNTPAAGNLVAGNFIGVNAFGTARPNAGSGVRIVRGLRNRVGGPTATYGNVIAWNRLDGVTVASGTGNAILTNAIHHNGFNSAGAWTGGLGIDLNDNGVTLNDAAPDPDGGANNLQNFPEILLAHTSGGTTTIRYRLVSSFNTAFAIQFFASPAKSPSNYGEGQRYLGTVSVVTNGAGTTGILSVTFPAIPAGQWVTATATRGSFTAPVETSEFSKAFQVT